MGDDTHPVERCPGNVSLQLQRPVRQELLRQRVLPRLGARGRAGAHPGRCAPDPVLGARDDLLLPVRAVQAREGCGKADG